MIVSKRVGAAVNHLCVFSLFGIQVRGHQQVRHAHDAVHRRADLVAHRGKEFRLEARCCQGALMCFCQGCRVRRNFAVACTQVRRHLVK